MNNISSLKNEIKRRNKKKYWRKGIVWRLFGLTITRNKIYLVDFRMVDWLNENSISSFLLYQVGPFLFSTSTLLAFVGSNQDTWSKSMYLGIKYNKNIYVSMSFSVIKENDKWIFRNRDTLLQNSWMRCGSLRLRSHLSFALLYCVLFIIKK